MFGAFVDVYGNLCNCSECCKSFSDKEVHDPGAWISKSLWEPVVGAIGLPFSFRILDELDGDECCIN